MKVFGNTTDAYFERLDFAPMCPTFDAQGYVEVALVNGTPKPVCADGFHQHLTCERCGQFCHNVTSEIIYPCYSKDCPPSLRYTLPAIMTARVCRECEAK